MLAGGGRPLSPRPSPAGARGTIPAVRTLLRWIVVMLGIAALVRWLRRRSQAPASAKDEALENPADELRRKLAESRAVQDETTPSEPASSVEARRSEVHEQGRAALSEMTPPDEG